MGTGTNVTATLNRKLVLHSARFEAYLSTHSFEILFVGLFVVANILMYVWGARTEYLHTMKQQPALPRFKWYIAIARGAGYTLNLNSAIVLILASKLFMTAIRDTPLHKVLPLDKSFPAAHIIVGYFILAGVAVHVPFHLLWLFKYNKFDKFTWWSFSMTFALGFPLLAIFISMFVTAMPWMRRKFFRVFYLVHIAGASSFFILLLLHGMWNKKPETYKWVAPGMILYVLDRICRRFKMSTVNLELSGAHSTLKPGRVLELRLPKCFNYRAGQYAELSVPFISNEWHPFTIASAPYEDHITFYIKSNGDWTTRLYQEFEQRISNPGLYDLKARIRGPYGAPAQHGTEEYKRVVLISGGIGATPFASISKDLHHRRRQICCEFPTPKPVDIDSGYDDVQVPRRVSMTVDRLYDLKCFEGDELDTQMKQGSTVTDHISDTLTLEKSSGFIRLTAKSSGMLSLRSAPAPMGDAIVDMAEPFAQSLPVISKSSGKLTATAGVPVADASMAVGNEEECPFADSFPRLDRLRARALTFLHATRVALLLLFTLVVRFSLVCIVAIWNLGNFDWISSKMEPAAYWAICTDAALGIFLLAVMALTIALEMSYLRKRFFNSPGRCLDFAVFLPASILSSVMSLKSCANPYNVRGALTSLHFALFLPVLFLLLSYRMYRSVGARWLLDGNKEKKCECSCGQNVPDVDYVWTTQQASDDEWLRDELESLADGCDLRLRRYITRGNEMGESGSHIQDSTGRPDWDELFESIVECTQSGGDVGVFFCGPPEMGKAIRKSLRDVEVHSNLRGSYLFSLSDAELMTDFAARSKDDVRRLRRFGCNVRFVFREENF